jgi:hypothetical protein
MAKLLYFKNLLDILEKECPVEHSGFKYIGTGNPNSNILIVGKETAIASDSHDQIEREMEKNFKEWKSNVEKDDLGISEIKECDWANPNPLYPYKGQLLKIHNGNNDGTSRTWYNYQKLINMVFNTPENNTIDFHEKVFITETNSTPSHKTKDAEISSIEFRKKVFLRSEFFQSFPVVILAGVGYYEIGENINEVESIFGVKFSEKRLAGGKESQPYWVHYGSDRKKMLINTRQLSINVSDALLQEVAALIWEWAEQEKIDLSKNGG